MSGNWQKRNLLIKIPLQRPQKPPARLSNLFGLIDTEKLGVIFGGGGSDGRAYEVDDGTSTAEHEMPMQERISDRMDSTQMGGGGSDDQGSTSHLTPKEAYDEAIRRQEATRGRNGMVEKSPCFHYA